MPTPISTNIGTRSPGIALVILSATNTFTCSSSSIRTVRLRDYRYAGELISLSATLVVLLSLFALFTLFFPSTWSASVKAIALAAAGLAVYVATRGIPLTGGKGGPAGLGEAGPEPAQAAEQMAVR